MNHKQSGLILVVAFIAMVASGQESAPPCQNPQSETIHKYYRYKDAQGCEHGEVRAEELNGAKCLMHGYCECGDSSS